MLLLRFKFPSGQRGARRAGCRFMDCRAALAMTIPGELVFYVIASHVCGVAICAPPKKTHTKLCRIKGYESRGNLGKNTHKPMLKTNHRLDPASPTYV